MAYILAGCFVFLVGVYMVSPMFFPGKRIKSHAGVPESTFVAQLSAEGVADDISSVVFRYYKQKAHAREFSPSPEMVINDVFEEGPDDIDDAAQFLLNELCLEHPSEQDRETYGRDVQTAGDLAQWLQWARNRQPL